MPPSVFWRNWFKPKTYKRRKVRRMGNFGSYVELYIYVIMGLIIIGSLVFSMYGRR